MISSKDFYRKQTEFVLWLVENDKVYQDLSMLAIIEQFKIFCDRYNSRKLDRKEKNFVIEEIYCLFFFLEKYYSQKCTIDSKLRGRYVWKFYENLDADEKLEIASCNYFHSKGLVYKNAF
jgi:hypothetical protein